MLGAPVLAASAALRSGAGWVQVAVDRTLLPSALSVTPELVGLSLSATPASLRELRAAAERADSVVVGPGMGLSTVARRRLEGVLKCARPTVVDADALTLLGSTKTAIRLPLRCVLTPHPGELPRLARHFSAPTAPLGADDDSRRAWATAAARGLSTVVVLKGARTIVTDGGRLYIEPTITSALAKAGTGDVLAGILGTLLMQMSDPFDAAVLAVSVHARCGVLAGERLGDRSTLALDVIGALPDALRERE
jgi:NAD(P)H-hydrate epimerase